MPCNHQNECDCSSRTNSFPKIIALPCPVTPITPIDNTLGFGSLRGDTVGILTPTMTPIPFPIVGPLSKVSAVGNELVVENAGVYQITVSINSQATTEPDPFQSFFTVSITVNGSPIFLQGLAVFNVINRSSSTFVVQAELAAGDSIGASASAALTSPLAGYANRSLTVVQLSNS
ncbi:hypothetical protein [Lysinibacillus piscis]|uniref:Exosporium leader peptide n=1 Tax=Lysinibacillus piscis TaxID=2518931 RepID=A0ABQ5NIW9_9BACI|nr:hypothetical protein [Lysinibacillus sp. KH24]GLC88223.1 hypothetical protein LYSBPC_13500 [Lysinibacillus sp. KH24]